jgi:MFS superfamily sulfate permease-like transporter
MADLNSNVAAEDQTAKPYHWGQDALASVVVFFVALPLCMGIALASGAPIAAGLITGIVGGIVAGTLAGCPLQVSGPAAGLTVIVYEIVQRLGLEMLGLVVLVAGGIQILAGACKLGQWFRAVSPAVIKGMLAGIGVLIFASQFHVMVDDKPRKSGLENLTSIPEAIYKSLGVPSVPSLDERKVRTESLQAIADLLHRQINVRTQVAELIPFHDVAHLTPELEAVVVDELHPLEEAQGRISKALGELAAMLDGVEEAAKEDLHLTRARAALADAVARSQEAERALEAGRAVDAVQTQRASVAAIELASSRLKNHRLAAWLGILTIVAVILWTRFAPKRLRLVPGPLVGVSIATTLAAVWSLPVLFVEIPGSLADEIHWPTWTLLSTAPWEELFQAGLLIAVVASAETLLCAAAVDQLVASSRTNYDKELIAQGAGNAVCGLLGALPMTGVIVRSSANIQAGGRTRLSAILHGLWLLVFVVAFSGLLQLIPTASLAAVLVYTGYKLVDVKTVRKLWAIGWGEAAIYFATLATIVVEDLLTGVIVGVVLAAGKLLYTFSHLKIRLDHDSRHQRFVMHLAGAATFVRLPQLAAALESVPEDAELHVELDRLKYIDHACLELLTSRGTQHEAAGGKLVVDWSTLHATFQRDAPSIDEDELTTPGERNGRSRHGEELEAAGGVQRA